MYSLLLKKKFVAQHYLIGGDWGSENKLHSHHYGLELEIHGDTLNQHNYLIDIIEFEHQLGNILAYFIDKTLNELPEFYNQNPSLEFFCKILWQKISLKLALAKDSQIRVTLWEDTIARASYWQPNE